MMSTLSNSKHSNGNDSYNAMFYGRAELVGRKVEVRIIAAALYICNCTPRRHGAIARADCVFPRKARAFDHAVHHLGINLPREQI